MPTETFAPESYPEPGARATRTISSRLRDGFRPSECRGKRLLVICAVVFLIAFGVRFLSWQDNRREVRKVQTYVTSDYQDSARQLLRGDLRAFLGDLNHMEHPPGYPLLLAGIFKTFGESDTAIQFMQMIADAAAAVFVFLIAGELFALGIAATAGILAALSPQFAYHSVLLLPDSLAVLPILIAIYFLVRAIKQPRFRSFAIAGAFIGLSCWLRANALLLAPFLACLMPLFLSRGRRLRYSLALVFGAAILIAPITIKNAIVFHRFIPLSLGAGQTLLEGIADYDTQRRFNIPRTDIGVMKQEAEDFHRPDYYGTLFNPDGVERERWRIRRGLKVIGAHPVWYSSVMFRRGISFFRMDRVPIVAAEAPVSHALDVANTTPAWTNSPSEFLTNAGFVSAGARAALSNAQNLRIESDETRYGVQILSPSIAVEKHHDYLLRLPLKLEDGRVMIRVTDPKRNAVLASTDVDLNEVLASSDQPVNNLALPFVSGTESQVSVSLWNNAPVSARSVAEIGSLELFDLGPSAHVWMHYPRLPIRALQELFATAAVLPCVILGILALLWTQDLRTLILLLLVPAYYVIFQSALHTERRYVIAIHYVTLILAAVFLSALFGLIKHVLVSLSLARQTPT